MGVDAPQNYPVPQFIDQPAHAVAEEAGSRSEIIIRWVHALLVVHIKQHLAHFVYFRLELRIAQGSRGFVVHGVVAKLVSVADKLAQALFAALDLGANDEKGGLGIISPQKLHYLSSIHARRIVNRKGNDLLFGRNLEQNVGPFLRKVSNEGGRRLVDDVERDDEEEREEEEEQ